MHYDTYAKLSEAQVVGGLILPPLFLSEYSRTAD
jgi:hypothetical protein